MWARHSLGEKVNLGFLVFLWNNFRSHKLIFHFKLHFNCLISKGRTTDTVKLYQVVARAESHP